MRGHAACISRAALSSFDLQITQRYRGLQGTLIDGRGGPEGGADPVECPLICTALFATNVLQSVARTVERLRSLSRIRTTTQDCDA